MKKHIIKLLLSENDEDIFLGWEMLISPQNLPKTTEEWFPYLDCFFRRRADIFGETFVKYVGGINKVFENEIWIEWSKTWRES